MNFFPMLVGGIGGGGNYEVILNNATMSAPYGVWAGSTVTLDKGMYFYHAKLVPYYSSICSFRELPVNSNVTVRYSYTCGNMARNGSGWSLSNPLGYFVIFEVTEDGTQVDLSCSQNGYANSGTLYEYLAKLQVPSSGGGGGSSRNASRYSFSKVIARSTYVTLTEVPLEDNMLVILARGDVYCQINVDNKVPTIIDAYGSANWIAQADNGYLQVRQNVTSNTAPFTITVMYLTGTSGAGIVSGAFTVNRNETVTVDTGLSSVREFCAIGYTNNNAVSVLTRFAETSYNFEETDYGSMQTSTYYTPVISSISGGVVTIQGMSGTNVTQVNYKYYAK